MLIFSNALLSRGSQQTFVALGDQRAPVTILVAYRPVAAQASQASITRECVIINHQWNDDL